MNILLQTGSWDFPKGGTDYFTRELAKFLEKKGHEVFVIANRKSSEDCSDHSEGSIHIYYTKPLKKPLSSSPFYFLKHLLRLRRLVKKINKDSKVDAALLQEQELFGFKRLKGRIILRGGGLFYRSTKKRFKNPILKLFMRVYNNITLKYANYAIGLSQAEKEFFESKGIKTEIIPHGVDINLFKPIHKTKFGKIKLCYVGMKEPIKHPKKLYELLEKVKGNFEFKWIGKNGDIDFVPNKKLPEILNKFDIFVSTEQAWGVGKSTIEAAACGLPVVSLNYGKAEFGFFTDSEEEWIKKVEELIESKELREKEGKRNRKIIKEKYTKDKIYSKYLKIFETFKNA